MERPIKDLGTLIDLLHKIKIPNIIKNKHNGKAINPILPNIIIDNISNKLKLNRAKSMEKIKINDNPNLICFFL